MSVWKCPVCGSFMQHRGKSWSCAQGHNFDMAKSGYVNLLPVNRKHAKNPGDNAVMMRARKNFLDVEALCSAVTGSGTGGSAVRQSRRRAVRCGLRRGLLHGQAAVCPA